ncbi:hypothetical protein [Pseudooceanicola sp. MF1-13]|uniref:hypothetical protein n=1 Tax=Pseudooceanicola sp. MF1-13 TaxID=3379095 RepID=UPI003891B5EC
MASFFSRLFGTEKPDLPQLPRLDDPEDFYDMTFAITGIVPNGNMLTLRARAMVGDAVVGFDVTLPEYVSSGLERDADGNVGLSRNATLSDPVVIKPVRDASAALARALPDLTTTRPQGLGAYLNAPKLLPADLTFVGIHLEEGDRVLRDTWTRIKLFYDLWMPAEDLDDEDAPILYWEAFLIPDLPNGVLRLDEKDPTYRQEMLDTLIAAWT